MSNIIAIVGRPNVGKSALFNRIIGRRIAIVHDQPGVTRDRISAEADWHGQTFTLIDTGGIGLLRGEKSEDAFVKAAIAQVNLALETAHLILFVVNAQEGLAPLDVEVASQLRRSGKPIYLVVNKVDNAATESFASDFASLGFTDVFAISAIHGRGISSLMDKAIQHIELMPKTDSVVHDPLDSSNKLWPEGPLKIAIVGRPNVGKSSLTNALTKSNRVIVTPIAGTTRDSVDVPFEVVTEGHKERFILIDTAGLRKRRRVDDSIEFFSVKRAEDSIFRADIVLFVIDAETGIAEQDKKIADIIVQARKGCIIVINKWDLVAPDVAKAREKEVARIRSRKNSKGPQMLTTLREFGQWVQEKLFFLDYAPVIFTSATEGIHLEQLLESVRYVAGQLQQKIPTAVVNKILHDAVESRQPVSSSGLQLKFFYATQVQTAPPTFWLFVNRKDIFSEGYYKYLQDEIRKAFGFEGCPIMLIAKPRPKTIDSKRTPSFGQKSRSRSHK